MFYEHTIFFVMAIEMLLVNACEIIQTSSLHVVRDYLSLVKGNTCWLLIIIYWLINKLITFLNENFVSSNSFYSYATNVDYRRSTSPNHKLSCSNDLVAHLKMDEGGLIKKQGIISFSIKAEKKVINLGHRTSLSFFLRYKMDN